MKSDRRNICIHKGLLPADYEKPRPSTGSTRRSTTCGKAAKDWPQLNFVIYHRRLRPFLDPADESLAQFESTGPHATG